MSGAEGAGGDAVPELTVVVPAFNEADNIESVVGGAVSYLESVRIDYEIAIVDDGSRDGTAERIKELGRNNPKIDFVIHPANRGYGAALRSGIEMSRGNRILVSDGDGQFPISDLGPMWERRDEADMVIGYRAPRRDLPHRRFAGWLYGRLLVRLVFGGRHRDVNCGFKLISRRVLEGMELVSNGALVSAELLTRARLRGASFVEVAVRHLPRRQGRATGLLPRVVLTMVKEMLFFRSKILSRSPQPAAPGLRTRCDAVESPTS